MSGRWIRDMKIAGRVVHKNGLPVSLIFFVTSKCNLLCSHCFYWEELNKPKSELNLEEIEKITKSLPNLLTVSLTGGEPYLRQDIAEIAYCFEKNSHVRNIQIPSNGLLVDKTIDRVEQLMSRVQNARVSTGVSLDGPEEIHNKIRQNPKSFQKAIETFRGLKELKPSFPNLSVGVALTVSAANQHCLDDFFEQILHELDPDAVTITLTRGDPIDPSLKDVDPEIYRQFSRRVIQHRKKHLLKDSWIDRLVVSKEEETYNLIDEATSANERIAPCYSGELIGILSETGDVFLCETLDRKMGNIREHDYDFSRLWSSAQASSARQYQKNLGCQCTYECAMSVNTLFNPRRALRIVTRSLTRI